MGKSVAAMVVSFIAGGAAMGLLSGVLGLHAETAALGVVGIGLIGSSFGLARLTGPATHAPGQHAEAR